MPEWKQATLGERLKELREERNASQKDVAQYIGVSDRVYSYYEDGRFPKNEDALIKLSLFFDVTIDFLLGKNNSKTGSNDNLLRATGLDDKSLHVIAQDIRGKDAMNKLIQHDDFSLLVNLLSLYLSTDQHRLLAHINGAEDKLPSNEREQAIVNAYWGCMITDQDKENKRLPPIVATEIVLYLKMLTQYEPLGPFFFSVMDNTLNKMITELKQKNDLARSFPGMKK